MHITKINDHIQLIDLELNDIRNSIASYVLTGKKTIIVETGPASTIHNLLSSLNRLNVKAEDIIYVAVSHIHLDHAGAAGKLLDHLPNARLIVHQRGASHMADPRKLWFQAKDVLGSIAEIYGKPEPVSKERIIAATDGMIFDVGNGVELKVEETLGHASHHLSFYETLSEGIFTGDAAGIYLNKVGLVVPTTPPPFRLDIAVASLKKLIELEPACLYYSHFGKASNAVEKLRMYIKQLRLWAETAKKAIDKSEDLDFMRKRLLENDQALQKAAEHIKDHPILSKTVLNQSVEGIMKFVEKV